MQWKTIILSPSVQLIIHNLKPTIPLPIEREVDNIWADQKKNYTTLFNGRVFTVDKLEANLISGYWTEYKYVLAQTIKTNLFANLHIRSLAVNGLIQCLDGFILGKRSKNSVYLPGYWQSPPAGTVESRYNEHHIDLCDQLYIEAKEELGLNRQSLSEPKLISATEHEESHIIDLGFFLETSCSFKEIYQIWKKNANPEYDALICLPRGKSFPNPILPTTQFLIQSWQ